MPKALTCEELDRYMRDGFVFPLRAMPADRARAYRARLEASECAVGGAFTGTLTQKPHLLFTWLDELAREPAILDAIEDLIGPDLLLWSTEFFIKNPGDGRFVTWHQDDTYWHIEPTTQATAWIALDDVPLSSGPVRYLPGSHRDERLPVVNRPGPDNMLISGQIAQNVDSGRAVDAVLAAGEMAIHHTGTLHESAPNRSTGRRVGIAARFVPTAVRSLKGRESALLVRGSDRYGHFDHEPRPAADLDAAARAAHVAAVEKRLRNMHGDAARALHS
ncbi:MAG: phytanoyl-CoA dioxygenase family protein [Alphaproteobacteria bacterium]|jgi:chlorinating enzyme